MNVNEFGLKVQKAIASKLGEGYQVRLQEVAKNNGVILHGLLIMEENRNISPTIYLNSFWEYYERGIPFAIIVERILQIYEEDTPEENIDMSFFKEFEKVKEQICFRVISAERNAELLQKIPHINYLDMAVCFYYAYRGDVLGNGSILIHNTHMEMWNTTVDELLELARCNTPRIYPWERTSMEEIFHEVAGEELSGKEYHDFWEEVPMYVVSNKEHVYGAAVLLYTDVLKQLAADAQRNLYVIPSSIHEIIVLQDNGKEDVLRLKAIIEEVNCTQVEPEEILSDNLYFYNRHDDVLSII